MKHIPFLVAAAAVATVASIGAANASVIFTLGDNPQPGEENILFGSSQTGTTITGATNQSHTPVQFMSTQSLTTGGIGQAFRHSSSPPPARRS